MPVGETALLQVENLTKRFGGILALDGFDIRIHSGEMVGLIGPNGAGKTTVFNLLSGVLRPTSGHIYFDGKNITGRRPDENTSLGIARTFQNIRLFNELSVEDNIKVAFHLHLGKGFWPTLLHTAAYRRAELEMARRADEYLRLFDLTAMRYTAAKNLPYGLQRRVEIARAMAVRPKLLLLDEPSAGLNASETDEFKSLLQNIHQTHGLTILLVEHDMKLIMDVCQKIQVIDQGRMLAYGSPHEVRRSPRVIEAYLGQSAREKQHA